MLKNRTFLWIVTIACCISETVVPNLTTMQHWDPSPHYSANNFMMPSHSAIQNLRKARKKDIDPQDTRNFGISLTGFVQGACRATAQSGCKEFATICGNPSKGKELGDFRGTMYAMGLFLGLDPQGKSIWSDGIDDGNATKITESSINNTELPSCVREAAIGLATPIEESMVDKYMIYDISSASNTNPSVFSEKYLEDDTHNFGAFSTPLEYKKFGFRLEFHADITKNIGVTIQTGVSNIKQRTTGLLNLSECPLIAPGCNDVDSNGNITNPGFMQSKDSLWNLLDYGIDSDNKSAAQATFKRYVAHNIDKLLDIDCGINQRACTFDEYSIEDIRFMLHFKHAHEINHFTKHEGEEHDWPAMIFTPYLWLGATAPTGRKQDYDLLFSLPFGNNGHVSAGGGFGMTFDFAESVEVGVEGGGVWFAPRDEYRPFPNHKLQRMLYPYRTNVRVEPGLNWHFKALLNAYQFSEHVSFWSTYEFIEHRQDKFILCNKNTATVGTREERIFIPEVLECNSDWRAQFINLGLVFDVQPGLQASFMWQQPIAPRNAYHPVSLLGSISFTF